MIKNALILHGTDSNPNANWFPWLKNELEKKGYKVWVPALPHANKPNLSNYNSFIFSNSDWVFNEESVIIGHSSGAVAILGLLEALPKDTAIKKSILVGSFMNDLGWDSLKELFLRPLDFNKIKKHSNSFIFIHSDNDPYCPIEHAKYLAEKVSGRLIIKPKQGHFSGENVKIPEILQEL